MVTGRAPRFSRSMFDSADWLIPTCRAKSGWCQPSFSRRLRMAAPFWRSLTNARPLGFSAGVMMTVCVRLMEAKLSHVLDTCKPYPDTDGHYCPHSFEGKTCGAIPE